MLLVLWNTIAFSSCVICGNGTVSAELSWSQVSFFGKVYPRPIRVLFWTATTKAWEEATILMFYNLPIQHHPSGHRRVFLTWFAVMYEAANTTRRKHMTILRFQRGLDVRGHDTTIVAMCHKTTH